MKRLLVLAAAAALPWALAEAQPDSNGTTLIPSNTQIVVRTNESITSTTAEAGQTFDAVIDRDILNESGEVVIPRGCEARLVIREVRNESSIGSPSLVLDLDSVNVSGRIYRVSTYDVAQSRHSGIGANRRTAEMVGGGAVLGTLLGALAGGGRAGGWPRWRAEARPRPAAGLRARGEADPSRCGHAEKGCAPPPKPCS